MATSIFCIGIIASKLGVVDVDVGTQDEAIKPWLLSHEPTPNLVSSFRRVGRGYLIGHAATHRAVSSPHRPTDGKLQDGETFSAVYLAKLRVENAKWRKQEQENADADTKLAGLEDSNKSEFQKATEAMAPAQKRATDAELWAPDGPCGLRSNRPRDSRRPLGVWPSFAHK